MTIKSGFFNAVNGDRRYKAEEFARYFSLIIGNGVFPNPSTGLQVIANNNMTVTLKAGNGWINGYYIMNDSDYILNVDVADGVLNRIDRIVLRLDYLTRSITPIVKKGTFATTPIAQTLQRDADAHEISVADVYVGRGAISITQANITDNRLNNSLCGIVQGLINQVDTTTIFNQYAAWFNEFSVEKQQDFLVWFDSIKDQLSGDVAGNLQLQIDALEQQINNINLTAQNVSVADTSNLFTGTNVEDVLKELFTSADNGKKGISTVIGSPATPNDTFDQLKTHIQTSKNTLATNLTNKGTVSSGTETLQSLANKVNNIETTTKINIVDFTNMLSVDRISKKYIYTSTVRDVTATFKKFNLNGTLISTGSKTTVGNAGTFSEDNAFVTLYRYLDGSWKSAYRVYDESGNLVKSVTLNNIVSKMYYFRKKFFDIDGNIFSDNGTLVATNIFRSTSISININDSIVIFSSDPYGNTIVSGILDLDKNTLTQIVGIRDYLMMVSMIL